MSEKESQTAIGNTESESERLGAHATWNTEGEIEDGPVFIVNEKLEFLSISEEAAQILKAPSDGQGSIEKCQALAPSQQKEVSQEILSLFRDETRKNTLYLRLSIQQRQLGGAKAYLLTARKEDSTAHASVVRCVLEELAPARVPKPEPSRSEDLAEINLGWTLDPKRRTFTHFGNPSPTVNKAKTLDDWLDLVCDADRQKVEEAFRKLLSGKVESVEIHYRIALEPSRIENVKTLARRLSNLEGDASGPVFGIHSYDPGNQRIVEDLKLFSFLAHKVQLSILVYDQDGYIIWCNHAFTETTGYSFDEIVGRDPNSLLRGPMTEVDTVSYMRERIRRGKAFHAELVQYKKNGAPYWCRIEGSPLFDESGELSRFISFQTDITESKKNQSAIIRNEIKFRSLFDNSSDALLLLSPKDGVIIEANRSAIQLLDTARLVGQRLEEIFPDNPNFRIDRLNEFIDLNDGVRRESGEIVTGDGIHHPLEMSASRTPIGDSMALLVTLRDISEKRLLEEQLRHSQRMEAVGRLAGGIAHDFNNLLAGQRGFCELLCNSSQLAKKDKIYATEVLKITDRASKLTSRLLSFSRGKSEKPIVANLNDTINNLMPMLSRILKKEIRFTSQLDPKLGNVKVDTNQIEQVIMNLVVNGQEAITTHDGEVTLRTSMTKLIGNEIFITGKPRSGSYIRVSVQDNGHGIPREVIEKIFEPFFTTKKGAGTGLGLSIVYGIIQSNGGHLDVESEIGSGTEFSFYFPEVHEAVQEESVTDPLGRIPNASTFSPGHSPTILVAEDQEQVREILELGLGQSGYNLIVARDGLEAIEKGKQHNGKIDLLLTDSMMPKASGSRVVQEMRECHPEIKVILVSGLPQQESEASENMQVDAYVDKPFSISKLLELIQHLLSVRR